MGRAPLLQTFDSTSVVSDSFILQHFWLFISSSSWIFVGAVVFLLVQTICNSFARAHIHVTRLARAFPVSRQYLLVELYLQKSVELLEQKLQLEQDIKDLRNQLNHYALLYNHITHVCDHPPHGNAPERRLWHHVTSLEDRSRLICLHSWPQQTALSSSLQGALSFEDESQVLHRHLDHHPTVWGSVVRFPEPCNNVARARVDVKVKLLLMLQVGWWTAVSLPWSLRWHHIPWIAFTRVALPFSVKYREVCSRCRPISGLQDIFYICGDFPVLMLQVKGTFCHFRQAMKLLISECNHGHGHYDCNF